MNSLITLISILVPLFLGFFINLPKPYLKIIDKALVWLVYVILLLIGVSLSQVENLGAQIDTIIGATVLLFACIIGLNLAVLMWFDRRHPWQTAGGGKKARVSIAGSIKQVGCVVLGFFGRRSLAGYLAAAGKFGHLLPDAAGVAGGHTVARQRHHAAPGAD